MRKSVRRRLAEKLRLLFDATHPGVVDVSTQAVWAAGELLRFNGNFNLYVQTRDLVKQEGIVFRHLLRLILLCGEFAQVCPPETTPEEWQADLRDIERTTDGELPRGRSDQHRRGHPARPRCRCGRGRGTAVSN